MFCFALYSYKTLRDLAAKSVIFYLLLFLNINVDRPTDNARLLWKLVALLLLIKSKLSGEIGWQRLYLKRGGLCAS
jgi:hypothetical protein